ncbi:hypothetical protein SARC_01131 [Sphaeroforma arctica JP610]|uniref:Uncharacterized protein n=1 Tax=Sphaeroforma arctica JP610 TaxID=667725 RepID=A0A0L0GCL4_9EUKA|nr:hypothetical protein SARC_01131 [Sphaeroforma arctica JP610]KNC86752.1 hypothetical protein SARC_01131 [Sphaeroforma arctica JP610]|eukprot:XP_014160654.1 hypothetical protein SARC_01131 [Sphaeroforma arctica JP610]
MVPRGYGRICNVSSVCGMNPTPNEAVYGATKAYLNSLGQSISYELVGTGVTMTTVCPGATITNFTKAANCEDALVFSLTFVPQLCSTSKYMAETSVKAALRGEVMVVAPTLYHVLCTMSESVLPIWFTLWMNCVVFKPAPSLRDISDGLKNAFWRTPKAKAL